MDLDPRETAQPLPDLPAAVFNHVLVAYAVDALSAAGMAESLSSGDFIVPEDGSGVPFPVSVLIDVLVDVGAVEVSSDKAVRLTAVGVQLFQSAGLLTWLLRASYPYLESMPSVLFCHRKLARDGALVAKASAQADIAYMRQVSDQRVLDLSPTGIADLGCGDGSRLLRLLAATKDTLGLGIDISQGAIEAGRANAQKRGLSARATFSQGDVMTCPSPPGAEHVDCVVSFLAFHDLLSASGGDMKLVVSRIRSVFPAAQHLVLADTTCDDVDRSRGGAPIFIRGFQYVHAVMGIKLHTLHQYTGMLQQAGCAVISCTDLGVPNTILIVARLGD